MRLILCGKNDAAVASLEHALANGDDVWVVANAGDDGSDGWQRSLRRAAEARGVPVDQPRRINAPDFVERLRAREADVLVSIQYDQILHQGLFERIGCPCLNLHFALLPRHRGVAPIAWAVAEGDAEAGVTLHHMVPDIDAGDLIAQRAMPIAPDATAREVYDLVTTATVGLFRETYPFPADLLARRLRQDGAQASYHRAGDFDFGQRAVDWARPAPVLQRWLRAMIFPPLQCPETTHAGRRLLVTRVGADVGPASRAPAGTVIAHADDGIDVAAGGGVLRVSGLCEAGAPGTDALRTLAVGDRFSAE